jgi:hypothetical protein
MARNLSQGSLCPGRDSIRASPEYNLRVLPPDQPIPIIY